MRINIKSLHFKADKKLEDFIKAKVEKVSSLYDGIFSSEVNLKLENSDTPDNKVVEIRLEIPGYDLYSKKQSQSFEEGTDLAVEALRRQIMKHKEKIRKNIKA
jgi:putative sigma-54 modulation protein